MWEQQGVHWFHLLGSLKTLTIGLILAGDEGGAREAGKGRRWGGAPESSVEQQGVHWFHLLGSLGKPNNWSDLAGDEGGRRGGCGPGRRARGGRWGQQRGGR